MVGRILAGTVSAEESILSLLTLGQGTAAVDAEESLC